MFREPAPGPKSNGLSAACGKHARGEHLGRQIALSGNRDAGMAGVQRRPFRQVTAATDQTDPAGADPPGQARAVADLIEHLGQHRRGGAVAGVPLGPGTTLADGRVEPGPVPRGKGARDLGNGTVGTARVHPDPAAVLTVQAQQPGDAASGVGQRDDLVMHHGTDQPVTRTGTRSGDLGEKSAVVGGKRPRLYLELGDLRRRQGRSEYLHRHLQEPGLLDDAPVVGRPRLPAEVPGLPDRVPDRQGQGPAGRAQGRGRPDQPAHPARRLTMVATTPTIPGRRSPRRPGPSASGRRLRAKLTVLSFIAPLLIGIAVFLIYPLISVVYFSFNKFNLLTPPEWVGLANYKAMLTEPTLRKAAYNTAWLVVVMVPARVVTAIAVSTLLTKVRRGT